MHHRFFDFGDNKYKALEEMKRVLKDEGNIIISIFSEDALEERMKVYKSLGISIKKVSKNGKVTFDESVGANTSEQFSKEELIDIFDKVGLKIDKIVKSGIGYICKISKIKNK